MRNLNGKYHCGLYSQRKSNWCDSNFLFVTQRFIPIQSCSNFFFNYAVQFRHFRFKSFTGSTILILIIYVQTFLHNFVEWLECFKISTEKSHIYKSRNSTNSLNTLSKRRKKNTHTERDGENVTALGECKQSCDFNQIYAHLFHASSISRRCVRKHVQISSIFDNYLIH